MAPKKTETKDTKEPTKKAKKAKKTKAKPRGRKPLGDKKMIKTSCQLPRPLARKIKTLTQRTRSRSMSNTIVVLLEQAIASNDEGAPINVDAAIGIVGEAIEEKHGARISSCIETHLHELLHEEVAA